MNKESYLHMLCSAFIILFTIFKSKMFRIHIMYFLISQQYGNNYLERLKYFPITRAALGDSLSVQKLSVHAPITRPLGLVYYVVINMSEVSSVVFNTYTEEHADFLFQLLVVVKSNNPDVISFLGKTAEWIETEV